MEPAAIFADMTAAVIFAALLLAVGARARQLLRWPLSPALRPAVDLSLGAWCVAMVMLGAGFGGALDRGWLLLMCATLAACGRWRGVRRRWAGTGAAAVGGGLALLVAAGPPFFYDAMVYHLGLPWQALMEGRLLPHPENLFAAFPPSAQLLALPPLAWGLDRVPGILHWFAWLVTVLAVRQIARRAGAPAMACRVVAGLGFLLPVAPIVAGFPAAEAWFLAPLFAAFAVLLAPSRPGAELGAGLLLGIACAARLQGLPWTILFIAAVAWRSRSPRRSVAAATSVLLGAAPWWLKNLVLLGDPVAPLFWSREGFDALWRDSNSIFRQGHGVLDGLAQLPSLIAPEALYLLPMSVFCLAALRSPGMSRRIAVVALVALGLWPLGGALPRFLSPTIFLLIATTGAAVGRPRWRAAAALSLGVCAVVGVPRTIAMVRRVQPVQLFSLSTAEATARTLPNDPQRAFLQADALPRNARVLFVAEPRGFGFPRRFVSSSQVDPPPLRRFLGEYGDVDQVLTALRAAGISHLLVNWPELQRLGEAYPVAPWSDAESRLLWSNLLRRLGPPVVACDGVQIFALPQ